MLGGEVMVKALKRVAVMTLSVCSALSLFGCGDSSVSSEDAASCAVEVGDVIDLGSMTFESCSGGTYSGNPEWLVIGVSGDRALVITKGCIDVGAYDEDSADWETSDIRQFLNDGFYNGLEDGTKQLVRERNISDTGTTDRVFLLEPNEASRLLGGAYQAEYVGCESEENEPYTFWKTFGMDALLDDMPWWLRTPDSEGDTEFYACSSGILYLPLSEGGSTTSWRGIRPAMWVELPVGWDEDEAGTVELEGESPAEEPASASDDAASDAGAVEAVPEPSLPDGVISWEDASSHVGEVVTVDGEVKGAEYATGSNGRPTFIDLGASYPDTSRVSVVVWGQDRSKFSGAPESMYLGKHLRVTGEIYLYNGACNIKVTSPSQIEVL